MSLSHTNSPAGAARLPAAEQSGVQSGGRSEQQSGAGPVVQVQPQRRREALERLLAVGGQPDQGHVQRFLDFSKASEIPLEAMWSLMDEAGRFTHTVLVVPSPGRTAMFFASHPADGAEAALVGSLINHAGEAAASMGVHLAQALLDPTEDLDRQMFIAGGFTELATLSYMERAIPRSQRGLEVQWPSDVALQPYDESLESEMIAVLESSYEDTLDCPSLRGLRETSDILRGHRSTGQFDPNLWTLLRIDGQAAGALLLNASPQQKSVELVYLGLARAARKRGLGRRLLRHGLSLVAGRAERTMTLAVDELNVPALALYRAEKFRCVLRRVAMIRPVRRTADSIA